MQLFGTLMKQNRIQNRIEFMFLNGQKHELSDINNKRDSLVTKHTHKHSTSPDVSGSATGYMHPIQYGS